MINNVTKVCLQNDCCFLLFLFLYFAFISILICFTIPEIGRVLFCCVTHQQCTKIGYSYKYHFTSPFHHFTPYCYIVHCLSCS